MGCISSDYLIFSVLVILFYPASFLCCYCGSCSNPTGTSFRGRTAFQGLPVVAKDSHCVCWGWVWAGRTGPDAAEFGSPSMLLDRRPWHTGHLCCCTYGWICLVSGPACLEQGWFSTLGLWSYRCRRINQPVL